MKVSINLIIFLCDTLLKMANSFSIPNLSPISNVFSKTFTAYSKPSYLFYALYTFYMKYMYTFPYWPSPINFSIL